MIRLLRSLAAAAALAAIASAGAIAGPLYYYVEDGRVVFTDTPSRKDVRTYLRDAGTRGTRSGATLPATPYDRFIEKVAEDNGLDPSLVKAVALVESGFDPNAVSPKGAKGLMQFMPSTAARYGLRDPHDPHASLRAGAEHLRDLLDEFDGDLSLALAAYNAGSGAVRKHGGVPAYRETRDYVRKVQERLGSPRRGDAAPRSTAPAPIRRETRSDGTVVFVN